MVTTGGVHHLTLIVRDVQRSKAFYQDICGMETISEEDSEVCGLTDGTFSLWLARSREGSKKAFNPEETGLNHWAFRVDSIEALGEIEEELRKQGIEMEEGGVTDDGFGGKAIYTKDPDGMKVEFHLQE